MYFPLARTSLQRGEFSSPVLSRRKSSQESSVWGCVWAGVFACIKRDFTLETFTQGSDTWGLIWGSHLTRITRFTQDCKPNWEIGQLSSHLSGWANQTCMILHLVSKSSKLTGLADPRSLLGMTQFQRLLPFACSYTAARGLVLEYGAMLESGLALERRSAWKHYTCGLVFESGL